MGHGFSKMKKQAKMLEEQFSKMQEELKTKQFFGEAGNGLVKVTLSGEKKLKSIKLSPECIDKEDIEGLEDLIIAAVNMAIDRVEQESKPSMSGLGGLF